jgi:hypothetical protein
MASPGPRIRLPAARPACRRTPTTKAVAPECLHRNSSCSSSHSPDTTFSPLTPPYALRLGCNSSTHNLRITLTWPQVVSVHPHMKKIVSSSPYSTHLYVSPSDLHRTRHPHSGRWVQHEHTDLTSIEETTSHQEHWSHVMVSHPHSCAAIRHGESSVADRSTSE